MIFQILNIAKRFAGGGAILGSRATRATTSRITVNKQARADELRAYESVVNAKQGAAKQVQGRG